MKGSFIKDDMFFMPYELGGYQCLILLEIGTISVRYGSPYLFTDNDHPYEVWYPTEDSPDGYQTADDIYNYIRKVQETYL